MKINIDTVDGATAYLKSKGVDIDAYVKRGIDELKNEPFYCRKKIQQKEPICSSQCTACNDYMNV